MAEEEQPVRLMNFVSESRLQELKATRGPNVEDGTLAPERPLHEILRENKQKQEQEFKDRFKHRPPKALDEEEMEFIEKLEMVKREHDRRLKTEEEKELSEFEAAVASRTISKIEPKPKKDQAEQRPKRPSQSNILASVIKVKSQPAKKVKMEEVKKFPQNGNKQGKPAKGDDEKRGNGDDEKAGKGDDGKPGLTALVAYDDDTDEDE